VKFIHSISSYFLLQVQIPGLENLQVFVPNSIAGEKSVILQLLNAAAGKDCSKDSDEVAYEAYLIMTKHSDKDHELGDMWSAWEGQPVKVVPQVETVDTLRSMQVGCFILFCLFVWSPRFFEVFSFQINQNDLSEACFTLCVVI